MSCRSYAGTLGGVVPASPSLAVPAGARPRAGTGTMDWMILEAARRAAEEDRIATAAQLTSAPQSSDAVASGSSALDDAPTSCVDATSNSVSGNITEAGDDTGIPSSANEGSHGSGISANADAAIDAGVEAPQATSTDGSGGAEMADNGVTSVVSASLLSVDAGTPVIATVVISDADAVRPDVVVSETGDSLRDVVTRSAQVVSARNALKTDSEAWSMASTTGSDGGVRAAPSTYTLNGGGGDGEDGEGHARAGTNGVGTGPDTAPADASTTVECDAMAPSSSGQATCDDFMVVDATPAYVGTEDEAETGHSSAAGEDTNTQDPASDDSDEETY